MSTDFRNSKQKLVTIQKIGHKRILWIKVYFSVWELGTAHSRCKTNGVCHVEFSIHWNMLIQNKAQHACIWRVGCCPRYSQRILSFWWLRVAICIISWRIIILIITSLVMGSCGLVSNTSSRRIPVLGGSKSAILGQMSVRQKVFLFKFHVGCGTNCTQQKRKHACNFVSL